MSEPDSLSDMFRREEEEEEEEEDGGISTKQRRDTGKGGKEEVRANFPKRSFSSLVVPFFFLAATRSEAGAV